MKRNTQAAGSVLALAILLGAIFGAMAGQPSLGTVIGIAIGALICIGLWLADRR